MFKKMLTSKLMFLLISAPEKGKCPAELNRGLIMKTLLEESFVCF